MSINKKKQTQSASVQNSEGTDNLHEEIQKKAYKLFEQRGCCHGHDCDDWYEAEKTVKTPGK